MTPLQKLPKNVGDLGKLIVAKANKSPNLVTLVRGDAFILMTPMRLGEDRVLRFAIYFELSREVTQKIGKKFVSSLVVVVMKLFLEEI